MVCCDNCFAWQHANCVGISEDEEELPESQRIAYSHDPR